jgi:hypothetical protein
MSEIVERSILVMRGFSDPFETMAGGQFSEPGMAEDEVRDGCQEDDYDEDDVQGLDFLLIAVLNKTIGKVFYAKGSVKIENQALQASSLLILLISASASRTL